MEVGRCLAASTGERGGEPAASSRASTAEQHEEIGKATGAMKYAEMASKLFDFKAMAKPPVLEGHKAVDWPEWKFKMMNGFTMLGLDDLVRKAEKADEIHLEPETTSKENEEADEFVFSFLCQVTTGKALTVVRLAGSGFRAWKHLCKTYEPHLAARWTAMLTSLLNPSWKSADSETQLLDWERKLHRYEEVTGAGIPEDIKSAVVIKWAPMEIKSFLKTIPLDLTKDYRLLRQYMGLFFNRDQVFDESGQATSSGNMPMDISSLQRLIQQVAWLKGKGGSGKGGKFGKMTDGKGKVPWSNFGGDLA